MQELNYFPFLKVASVSRERGKFTSATEKAARPAATEGISLFTYSVGRQRFMQSETVVSLNTTCFLTISENLLPIKYQQKMQELL